MEKHQKQPMSREKVLNSSDEEIIDLAERIRIGYELKKTIRYGREKDLSKHSESVAEHVFALFLLAKFFLPLEDPESNLDPVRIHELILFHDFGEIPSGDIPNHLKSEADEAQEEEDAKEVFQQLPESLNNVGLDSWNEYENLDTQEAQFAYALDKIEPAFELLDPISHESLTLMKYTYEMHITNKLEATEKFPVMRKFVDALSKKLKEDRVFWEDKS